jgi:hypothetical protein
MMGDDAEPGGKCMNASWPMCIRRPCSAFRKRDSFTNSAAGAKISLKWCNAARRLCQCGSPRGQRDSPLGLGEREPCGLASVGA